MSTFLVIYPTVQLLCLEARFLSGNIIIDCLVWLLSRTHTSVNLEKFFKINHYQLSSSPLPDYEKNLDTKPYDFNIKANIE